MKKWIIGSIAVVLGLPVLLLLILLRHGFYDLETKPYVNPRSEYQTWDQVLVQAPKVTLNAMMTGEITGDRLNFVNKEHPMIDKIRNTKKPVPVWSYGISHPQKGDMLIDAGYSSIDNKETLNQASKFIQWLMKGTNLQVPEQALESQLVKFNLDPKKVFLTHFHFDHIAGIVVLDRSTDYIVGKKELDFTGKAASGSYIKDRPNLYLLDFKNAKSMTPFDKVIDLLGDGSLWAIATPGHTAGHVSYLVFTETGPVLMTGDACFYYDAWEHTIDPYCMNPKNQKKAKRSLKQLKAFVELFPQTKVYVGHDEKQM